MHKETLLDFYSSAELNAVKTDIIEHHNGIKNIYVIDTFDVINYTLPFINKDSFSNDFKLAFTTIFYENIFSIYKDFDIILANEYKQELSSVVENFENKIKNFSSIREKLLIAINNSIDSDDKSLNKKTLYNEFELIIILYIFIEKGKNLFDRFNDFIESINVSDFKSDNITLNESELIIDAFNEINPSDLTNKLIELFVDSEKLKLASIPSEYERYCYLDNTYRDISVIDRVYNINKKIDSSIKVKYLSSTPKKTNAIIKLLKKEKGDKNCLFNRNINQLFLFKYLISHSETKEESLENIEVLINLKTVEKTILSDPKKYSFFKSINNSIESLKKEITNSYFFDSYTYYDELFKSILNKDTVSKSALLKIKGIIEKIDDNLPDKLLTDKLNSKLKLNQVLTLSQKLNDSLEESSLILINTGDDIIKNTFHHLPYLIFCEIKIDDTINEFYHFLNSLSNKSELIGSSSKEFKNEIDNILDNLSYKKMTLSRQIIDFMILTYLNLVTETKKKKYR